MTIPAKSRQTPAPQPARPLLIVARNQVALYQSLNRAFGGPGGIPVFFDRRQAKRRRAGRFVAEERRHGDRRSFPRIEDELRQRRYVLVRQCYRRPHD